MESLASTTEVPNPMVSVVVGNHNGVPVLENCLRTILACDYDNFEVILVDAGSTDGSVDLVRRMFANDRRLRVIGLEENVGSSRICNAGAKASKGEILAFADSDVEVSKNWLKELICGIRNNPDIGALQSVLLEPEMADTIQCAGIYMIDYCGWTWSLLKGTSYQAFLRRANKHPLEVGIASDTAMVVTREAFDRVRGFDEGIFMYFAEIDFSWRLRLAGYTIAVMPTSAVTHLSGEARKRLFGSQHGLDADFKDFDSQRNNLRMIIKNYARGNLIRFIPTTLLAPFILRLYTTVSGGGQLSLRVYFKAIWWNLKNLPATIEERKKVQRVVRAKKDDWVIQRMSRRLPLTAMLALVNRRSRQSRARASMIGDSSGKLPKVRTHSERDELLCESGRQFDLRTTWPSNEPPAVAGIFRIHRPR